MSMIRISPRQPVPLLSSPLPQLDNYAHIISRLDNDTKMSILKIISSLHNKFNANHKISQRWVGQSFPKIEESFVACFKQQLQTLAAVNNIKELNIDHFLSDLGTAI